MSFGIPVRNGLAIGLLTSTTLSSSRGLSPAMSLDFLVPSLDSRITFSRGSNATLVDATGKITYAPNNLFTYSQEFDNVIWNKGNATVTANSAVAPDGTTTADKLTETATTAQHFTYVAIPVTASTRYTMSVYGKAAERRYLSLHLNNFSAGATFDLQTGTVVGTPVSTGGATSSIISVGNGWYRCIVSGTSGGTATYNNQIGIGLTGNLNSNINANESYAGNGTDGIFIWGAQLEPVTYQTTPSTYVATTASAYYGPRFDYDPVTLAPKGLLIEEARTNLLLRSQEIGVAPWAVYGSASVSANATSAPDGTVSADLITFSAVDNGYAQDNIVIGSSVSATLSFYVKANVGTQIRYAVPCLDAGGTFLGGLNNTTSTITSGQLAANGWYRISVTFTTPVGTTKCSVRILGAVISDSAYVWGIQFEAGSFATSYIPTVASTVTRSADVASMTGTNFSSWYNQSEGTFVVSQDNVGVSFRTAIQVDGGSNSNRILLQTSSTSLAQVLFVNVANVSQVNLSTQTINSTGSVTAAAYKLDDYAYSVNGAAASTDNVGLVPTVTRMFIGSELGSSVYLNGHIRQIAYYNTRLPNAQLQTLTAPSLATTLSLSFTNQAYTVGV